MKKEVLKEPIFAEKILRIIRSSPSMEEMREQLRDYHDNDIAQSLKYLNRAERNLRTGRGMAGRDHLLH